MTLVFNRDFDKSNELNAGVGPDITFTRVDGAGAFYGGSYRVNPMNLFKNSAGFTTSWNTVDGTVVQSFDTTPDGRAAHLFLAGTGGASHRLRQTLTFLPQSQYRWSVTVKAHGLPIVLMECNVNSGIPSTVWDLRDGSQFSGSGHDADITDLGSGWYRCSNIFNTSSGAGKNLPALYAINSAETPNFTGTGSQGFLVSDAQITRGYLEQEFFETTASGTGAMGPRIGASWPDANGQHINRGLIIEGSRYNEIYTSNVRDSLFFTVRMTRSDASLHDMFGVNINDDVSTDNTHEIFDQIFMNSGQQYTFSVFARNPDLPSASLPYFLWNTDGVSGSPKTYINIEDATVGNMGHDAASIEDWGGDLRRLWVTFTATASGNKTLDMLTAISNGLNSYVGDQTHNIELYHPQVDKGAFPGLPSIAGRMNGEAAVASIAAGTSHTMMVEGFTGVSTGVLLSWDDGTENNRWRIERTNDRKILFTATEASALVASLTAVASVPDHTAFRIAITGHDSDYHISLDGATAVSEGGGGMPTIDELRFGDSPTGGEEWNSMIGKAYIWTGSSTTAELETLGADGVADVVADNKIAMGMGIGMGL